MLARLGLREQEIATRCGVSRSAVGHWITGETVPRDPKKQVLRQAYGIPIESWYAPAAHAEC